MLGSVIGTVDTAMNEADHFFNLLWNMTSA